MPYLWMTDKGRGIVWATHPVTGSDSSPELFVYACPTDLLSIYNQWLRTPYGSDQIEYGVWADWLEDHRDELLVGAVGPSDPAQRLDALIAYLRARFEGR